MSFTQTYKGVVITLDATGKFTATVSGKFTRKPSLDAMQKHINDADKVQFTPFTAIVDARHDDKTIKGAPNYTRVEVVGISKNTSRFKSSDNAFIIKRPRKVGTAFTEEAHGKVYEDTPENIALLISEDKKRSEKSRVIDRFESEIDAIEKKQKKLSADAYVRENKKSAS